MLADARLLALASEPMLSLPADQNYSGSSLMSVMNTRQDRICDSNRCSKINVPARCAAGLDKVGMRVSLDV